MSGSRQATSGVLPSQIELKTGVTLTTWQDVIEFLERFAAAIGRPEHLNLILVLLRREDHLRDPKFSVLAFEKVRFSLIEHRLVDPEER